MVGQLRKKMRILPEAIDRLNELRNNIRWSWDYKGRSLFRNLDYPLWMETKHNVAEMLDQIPQEKLDLIASDGTFLAEYNEVMDRFDRYMEVDKKWFAREIQQPIDRPVAYFSFEFD